ncbi:MAG: RPA12/RPB9/RPC11 RNA polymerase family protein [Candidatus Woesearchaeota archaeon]
MPKKKGSKTVMICSSCGHCPSDVSTVLSEKIRHGERRLDVVDKELEVLPIADVTCPKCGNEKAYYFFVQTRASDEPATQFLRCTKCRHQWRDYS